MDSRSPFLKRLQQLRNDLSQPPFKFSREVPLLMLNDETEVTIINNNSSENSFAQSISPHHSQLSGFRSLSPDQLMGHSATYSSQTVNNNIATATSPSENVVLLGSLEMRYAEDFQVVTEENESLTAPASRYHRARQQNAKEILSHLVVFTLPCRRVGDSDSGNEKTSVCGCGDFAIHNESS